MGKSHQSGWVSLAESSGLGISTAGLDPETNEEREKEDLRKTRPQITK